MTSNSIQDLLVLIADCVRQMFEDGGRSAMSAIAAAVFTSASCYLLCHKSTKLWNRRFHVRLVHHFYCIVSAIVGFVAVILYVSCPLLKVVALASIVIWQGQIETDTVWSSATFSQSYDEVKKLGMEPPKAFELSRKEDGVIPVSRPESQNKVASIYSNSASRHFADRRPFLSKLIRPSPEIPEETVVQDIKAYFESGAARDAATGKTAPYPLRRAIELVAGLMRDDLVEQLPRIVTGARLLVITFFAGGQALAFGGIGLAAYRDLKMKV